MAGFILIILLLLALGPYFAATGLFSYVVARALPPKTSTSLKVLAVCIAALTCIVAARPIGNVHARVLHFFGIDALVTLGLCSGPCRASEEILRDRYGVHMVRIAGCVVYGPEVWYAEGFDEAMAPLVVRERGMDVFEAASDEAWAPRRGTQCMAPQPNECSETFAVCGPTTP